MRGTKEKILDAAERLFAEKGYDATSMRTITAAASVNLAAINYHFNSKEELLLELLRRRLAALNRERLKLLDRHESEHPNSPVEIEKLVRAFIEPAFRMARDTADGGRAFATLFGRMYGWPSPRLRDFVTEELRETVGRFAAAFRRSLPTLTAHQTIHVPSTDTRT